MNNKLLMLVNEFPPSAESGVQRPVKFLKYLVRNGWEVYVVTPAKAVKQVISDPSLEQDIPSAAKIFRTRSWGISEEKLPGLKPKIDKQGLGDGVRKLIKLVNDLIFPFDKQIGWVPFAVWTAVRLIRKHGISNLYITAFPFSAFRVGITLKRLFGKKLFWVADYRDAWQFAPILQKQVLPFRFRRICKTDEKVLRTADHIVFTSPFVLDRYRSKYPWLADKSDSITNGYDEDDFTGLQPQSFNKFTLVYMGKIYPAKGSPLPLLRALNKALDLDLQFLHLGTVGKSVLEQINLEGLKIYNYLGYKSHPEALSYSAGADINVIIVNNDPDSQGVIPGKLFELIRIGKPILAVGPRASVVEKIVTETQAGTYVCSDDEQQIAQSLKQLMGGFQSRIDISQIEQYSRQACTQRLERIFTDRRPG